MCGDSNASAGTPSDSAENNRRRRSSKMVHVAAPLVATRVVDNVWESVVERVIQVPMGVYRADMTVVAEGILGVSMSAVTTVPSPAKPWISSFDELPHMLMELFMGLPEDPVVLVVATSCAVIIALRSHILVYRNKRGATFRYSAVRSISGAKQQHRRGQWS